MLKQEELTIGEIDTGHEFILRSVCQKCLWSRCRPRYEVVTDHMRWDCGRCGYSWVTACADAHEPTPDTVNPKG